MRRESSKSSTTATSEDAPWLEREDWANGRVLSTNRAEAIGAVLFAGVWDAISSVVAFFAIPDLWNQGKKPLILVVAIFPVIGVVLDIWALRCVIRLIKFGTTVFELDTCPGVVGRTLEGALLLPVALRGAGDMLLSLDCVKRVTTRRHTGNGSRSHTSEIIEWQDRVELSLTGANVRQGKVALPVRFHIPAEALPTTPGSPSTRILWRLIASADVPGVDFGARFEVPVFCTEDSPTPGEEEAEPQSQWATSASGTPRSLDEDLSRVGIFVERPPNRMQVQFRRARCKTGAAMLTGFAVLWTGVCIGLSYSDAPILFPIMFGLTDLLIVWGAFDAWLWHGRVRVGPGRLESRAGIFIATTKQFQAGEIRGIGASRGTQFGNTVFYRIRVRPNEGSPVTIGKYIGNRQLADALAEEIQQFLTGNGGQSGE